MLHHHDYLVLAKGEILLHKKFTLDHLQASLHGTRLITFLFSPARIIGHNSNTGSLLMASWNLPLFILLIAMDMFRNLSMVLGSDF